MHLFGCPIEKNIFNQQEKQLPCFKFNYAPKLFMHFGKFYVRLQKEEKTETKLFFFSVTFYELPHLFLN